MAPAEQQPLSGRLSASQRLGLLGLLWLGIVLLGWRLFPLARLYPTPLLDLAKLTDNQPGAWLGAALSIALFNGIYLAGWRAVSRSRTPVSWPILLAIPPAVALCLVFTYPLTAADLFDHLALGHLAAFHGVNPFTHTPADFPSDPFVAYAAWRHVPSAYGPLWELFAGWLARLAAGDLWRGILLMKAQALLSLALVSALTAWLVWRRQRAPRAVQQALFLLLWNPLLLLDIGGNAHHDLWIALAMLAAVGLAQRRRFDLALVALTAGALVKLFPLLVAPLFVVTAVRRLDRLRALRQLALGTILSAFLAWLCYRPFWPLADPLRLAQRGDLYTTSILALIRDGMAWSGVTAADYVAARLGLALLAGLVGVSAWRLQRAAQPQLLATVSRLLTAILLLATAWFQTWYLAWVWPLAALQPRSRLTRVLILFSTTAWFKYLLFSLTFGAHWPPRAPYWQQNAAATLLVTAPPLVYAMMRKRRPDSQ
jgi:alpha-1,6-mannosyltransferase